MTASLSATASIVLPVFGVMLAGYVAARVGLLGERVADGLSDFVFTIAVPTLLCRTLATGGTAQADPWSYWLSYFLALSVVWVLASAASRHWLRNDPAPADSKTAGQEHAIAGFSAAQSNTVLVGIPLVLSAFGDAATVPVFLLLAVHLPVTMTVATFLVERAAPDVGAGRRMALKLLTHPILIGIFIGVALRVTGIGLAAPVSAGMKLIADAASPCALFALGMTLNRYGLRGSRPVLAVIALGKLIIHPLLVWWLATSVFTVPKVWAATAILLAACPSGINAYLLAARYKVGVALSSGAISLTTVLCLFTVPFWVWVVLSLQ
jgi:hypothetical protein